MAKDASEIAEMRDRFLAFCVDFPGGAHGPGLWDVLDAAYRHPPRGYHSLRHIGECLEVLDSCPSKVADPAALELAIWVHDCVYDSTRHDNEERSAAVGVAFGAALRLDPARLERVRELVLATKHTGGALVGDAAVIADIDLSGLAAEWTRVEEILRGIRFEYAWVSDADFRRGRAAFLEGLLRRERLFSTAWGVERFEAGARKNMARQIDRLRESATDSADQGTDS